MCKELVCRSCSACVACSDAVFLWDGESYCSRCVEFTSVILATHARNSGVLAETVVPDAGWRMRGSWLHILPGVIVLALFGAVSGPTGLIFGGVFVLLFCGAVFLCDVLWARPQHFRRVYPRTLSVAGGILTITTPAKQVRCETQDCKWFEGKVWDTDDRFALSNRDAVILCVAPERARSYPIVALGLSQEARELWRGFLSLAGVPKSSRMELVIERTVGHLILYSYVLLAIAIFFAALKFGLWRVISILFALVICGLVLEFLRRRR